MNKSIEHLLAPRYKVIADWPEMNTRYAFEIGDILTDDGKSCVRDQDGNSCFALKWESYPHLFKKLKWLEERETSELPEYVKDGNGVYKVKEWHFKLGPKVTVFIDSKVHIGYKDSCDECPLYGDILPATSTDYTNYLNSKTTT